MVLFGCLLAFCFVGSFVCLEVLGRIAWFLVGLILVFHIS